MIFDAINWNWIFVISVGYLIGRIAYSILSGITEGIIEFCRRKK
jgi:uncharacterized membrane protein YhdT